MEAAIVAGFVATIAMVLTAAGWTLAGKLLPAGNAPAHLRLSCGFFLAVQLFLALIWVGSAVTESARLGVALSSALMLLLAGPALRGLRKVQTGRVVRSLLVLAALSAGYMVIVAGWWLWPVPGDALTVFDHLGTQHSGRYGNIAIFIDENDRVPRLKQNLGQAILAAATLTFGAKAPLAVLYAWLVACLTAFSVLVHGLMEAQGLRSRAALTASVVTLLANSALSLVLVIVLNTQTPLVRIGYPDGVLSAASILIFLLWLQSLSRDEHPTALRIAALPVLFGIGWTMSSPQNLVAAGIVLATLVMAPIAAMRRHTAIAALVLLIVSVAAVSPMGGFFVSLERQERGILGLMAPQAEDGPPGVGVWVREVATLVNVPDQLGTTHHAKSLTTDRFLDRFRSYAELWAAAAPFGTEQAARVTVFFAENKIWEALRLHFMPLAGFAGLALLIRRGRIDPPLGHIAVRVGLTAFLPGFAAAVGLTFNGYKVELERFLMPGSVIGFACLGLTLAALADTKERGWRRFAWTAVMLACLGPVAEFAMIAHRNILSARESYSPIGERIELLLGTTGTLVERPSVADVGGQRVRFDASHQSGDHHASRAFDGSTTPDSFWEVGPLPVELIISPRPPGTLVGYGFHAGEMTRLMPSRWEVSGSVDGVDWQILDSHTGTLPWSEAQTQIFCFNNTTRFRHYKYRFATGPGIALRLYELSMFWDNSEPCRPTERQ